MKSDTVESLPDTKKTARKVSEKLAKISLPSKRFRRVFGRPFEAFFTFWRRKNWGERNTDGSSGEGEGRREKETLARKPHDFEKRPFDTCAVG